MLLPLQGARLRISVTQGDALGYVLVAPAGRIVHKKLREPSLASQKIAWAVACFTKKMRGPSLASQKNA